MTTQALAAPTAAGRRGTSPAGPGRRLLALLAAIALTAGLLVAGTASPAHAVPTGNPVLPGNNADPSVEVFDGRYYIYPTSPDGRYLYAYSSTDLTNWTRSEPIFDRAGNNWSNSDTRLWAPDMVYRGGRYYLYYSLARNVGVAVCDSPVGPCRDKGSPLVTDGTGGIEAIDPTVFIDSDGAAYLYYAGSDSGGRMGTFRLNNDMTSVSGSVTVNSPQDFTEGSFVHKRNGTYYLTYSNGAWFNNTYNVRYATSASPLGPWTYRGQILSSDDNYQGPGHHSLLQYPGTDDWYIVYHRYQNNDYSARYTAIDRMYHSGDGSIQRIAMTSSGVESRPAPGKLSLQAAHISSGHLRHRDGLAYLNDVYGSSSALDKADATFIARAGLADARCLSFESRNYPGAFLRHADYRVRLAGDDYSGLFAADATFCPAAGRSGSGTSYESWNLRGSWLRHYSGEVFIASNGGSNPFDSTSGWAQDASWNVVAPWSP